MLKCDVLYLPIFMGMCFPFTTFLSRILPLLPLAEVLAFEQDLDPRHWTVAANCSEKVRIGQQQGDKKNNLSTALQQNFLTLHSQHVSLNSQILVWSNVHF